MSLHGVCGKLRDQTTPDKHVGFKFIAQATGQPGRHAFALTVQSAKHGGVLDFGQMDRAGNAASKPSAARRHSVGWMV